MKFSAKGEYGVRAVLEIALRGDDVPIHVKEIAKCQGIPERFLEQVMAALKQAGLVESFRGAQGGYMLAKDPAVISLTEVLQALEGPIVLMDCVSGKATVRCSQDDLCVIKEMWEGVQQAVLDALDAVTVASLCKKYLKNQDAAQLLQLGEAEGAGSGK